MRLKSAVKATAGVLGIGLVLSSGVHRAEAQTLLTADLEAVALNLDGKSSDDESTDKKSSKFSPWFLLSGLIAVPFLSGGGGSSSVSRGVTATIVPDALPDRATGSGGGTIVTTPAGSGSTGTTTGLIQDSPELPAVITFPTPSITSTGGSPTVPGVGTPATGVLVAPPVGTPGSGFPAGGILLPPVGGSGNGGSVGIAGITVTPEPTGVLSGLAALLTIGGSGFCVMARKRRTR